MQVRTVISNGRRFQVNVATNDDGIGAGFATGQLVMKSATDGKWYVVETSGSAPAALYVSQSALPFAATGPAWTQGNNTASYSTTTTFFEQNFPYQIVASNNGNAYAVYLTGTPPAVTVTVSQSAYGPAFITSSQGAVIATAKPYLLLQNITTGDYFYAGLTTLAGVTSISVNQTVVSQSWVRPIY
jgi:hypothetical protein